MNIIVSPPAHLDLAEAALHLDQQAPNLGGRLFEEFDDAIQDLRRYPEANPIIGPNGVRKKNLRGLRYRIIYRVHDDALEVIALMHQHRATDAWRDRL